MSLLLALDTATERPSIALGESGTAVAEIVIAHRNRLSAEIETVTCELLRAQGVGAQELGGVAVADGPGSFTGLRIGIAFAKGVCRALGAPLFTAPSMLGAAMSRAGGRVATVVVEYDALRGEVYRAVYRIGPGEVATASPPALMAAGHGVPPGGLRAAEGDARAASLIALAAIPGALRRVEDPAGWEPFYGRVAEAEARRLARESGS